MYLTTPSLGSLEIQVADIQIKTQSWLCYYSLNVTFSGDISATFNHRKVSFICSSTAKQSSWFKWTRSHQITYANYIILTIPSVSCLWAFYFFFFLLCSQFFLLMHQPQTFSPTETIIDHSRMIKPVNLDCGHISVKFRKQKKKI